MACTALAMHEHDAIALVVKSWWPKLKAASVSQLNCSGRRRRQTQTSLILPSPTGVYRCLHLQASPSKYNRIGRSILA